MLIMEELQKTYTVASIYRAIFIKALQLIFPGYSVPVAPFSPVANAATPASVTATASSPLEADVSGSTQFNDGTFGVGEGDLMDALMDEASIFSFWETWNQI